MSFGIFILHCRSIVGSSSKKDMRQILSKDENKSLTKITHDQIEIWRKDMNSKIHFSQVLIMAIELLFFFLINKSLGGVVQIIIKCSMSNWSQLRDSLNCSLTTFKFSILWFIIVNSLLSELIYLLGCWFLVYHIIYGNVVYGLLPVIQGEWGS